MKNLRNVYLLGSAALMAVTMSACSEPDSDSHSSLDATNRTALIVGCNPSDHTLHIYSKPTVKDGGKIYLNKEADKYQEASECSTVKVDSTGEVYSIKQYWTEKWNDPKGKNDSCKTDNRHPKDGRLEIVNCIGTSSQYDYKYLQVAEATKD